MSVPSLVGGAEAELTRLRQSMRDMVSLFALPAIWSGRSPAAILPSAVELLSSLVRLDVVYARLTPQEGHAEEAVHLLGRPCRDAKVIAALREGMQSLLDHPGRGLCDLPGLGPTQLLVSELGFYGETGLIAFGVRRPDFPDEAESILLVTAVNLLASALRAASAVDEAETARVRASFLAEASEALSACAQEPAALIATAARVAVGRVAESCAIDLRQASDASIANAALVHRDPVPSAEALAWHWSAEVRRSVAQVSRGEGARLCAVADGAGTEHLAVVGPVLAAGNAIGAVTLYPGSQRSRYQAADLEMAEDFGRRLGAALESSRLAQEARNADQRKDEFVAMLAHELRNPLAPILGAVQLMNLRGEVAGRELQIIERQVRHMGRLLDDLMDFSRIDHGKVELKLEPLLVTEVLANAVEIAGPLVAKGAQHLSVRVEPPTAHVLGDRVRLAQIFGNLLANAAKYSPDGAKIFIAAHQVDGAIRISVRDTGMGISAALLPRVFDLFVQGERLLERGQGGLGIGLTLVRNLVERHGGTVTAKSEGPGCGSEFIVELSAADAATAQLPAAVLGGEKRASPSPAGGPGAVGERAIALPEPKASSRLMVVDDNVDAAEMLADALRSFGHEVSVAFDGPQALLLAARIRPSAAVLDIGLPGMDGHELARQLLRLPGLTRLRLVALSGYGRSADKARSLDAGFAVHLVKPADLNAIVAAIADEAA